MPEVRIYQVDAFTTVAFGGNPAGVCLLEGPADPGWMQAVAAEMNLSETAFVHRDGPGWALRWFTPVTEVDLCGHATLAAAQVLWDTGAASGPVRFDTRSGALHAVPDDGDGVLDFPALPPKPADDERWAGPLASAIGVTPLWVGYSSTDALIRLRSPDEVRRAAPDLSRLRALPLRGAIITAAGDVDGGPADFVSRFFAPAVGIDEDPVTGSAHCVLAPYWAAELGRDRLLGHQISARGGWVGVRSGGARVELRGRAVTVMAGTLLV
jgi:PhzF family phenazine biosynthesis protein